MIGLPQLRAEDGQTYATSGYKAVLRKRIERSSDPANSDSHRAFDVAYCCGLLGDKEKTFLWLGKAYEERAGLNFLQVDPVFDFLRSDPLYAELVRRIGFPQ